MRLVNKRNLELAKLASKEESRYQLSAILLTEAETVVTDGHILARVSLPEHKAEQFPVIERFTPNGSNRDALIPREAALEAARRITKKTTIPILTCAAVTVEDKPEIASGRNDHEREEEHRKEEFNHRVVGEGLSTELFYSLRPNNFDTHSGGCLLQTLQDRIPNQSGKGSGGTYAFGRTCSLAA